MATNVGSPYPIFQDASGNPLEGGKIYIGVSGLNPETNPIAVYWDSAATIPAVQPITTRGGYPSYLGNVASIWVNSDYSITIRDKNDMLVFSSLTGIVSNAITILNSLKTVDGAGSGLVAEGLQSLQITNMDFDPTALGLSVGETRIYATNAAPSNPPFGITGYFVITLNCPIAGEYRMTAMASNPALSTPSPVMFSRRYSTATWGVWGRVGNGTISITTGSSPYTLAVHSCDTLEVNSTTNPHIVNLPTAASGVGYRVKIVNTSALATGLVKIVPSGTNKIGPMPASTAIYLQNVDQSAWQNGKQAVELVSDGVDTWSVDGQWMPEPGSIDSAGSQYQLGRIRNIPLGNTTARTVFNSNPGIVGAWTSAINVTGTVGIPAGAKAIKASVQTSITSTAGGQTVAIIAASDNITNTPTSATAHPGISYNTKSAAGGDIWLFRQELVIPLNSSGQFFLYTIALTNVTNVNTSILINATGYYMGD